MSRSTPLELPAVGLLDLPKPWLVDLVQHVASGPDGLASAATLSQTCKLVYKLSESSAVTYRNIYVRNTIVTPNHPVWMWLAKRRGRVAGLFMKVLVNRGEELVYGQGEQHGEQPAAWEGPWQSLATVQDLQLALCIGSLDSAQPHTCQWLDQHSHFLANFSAHVSVDSEQLTLQSLSEALAPCKSLDLDISHPSPTNIDISRLIAVKSSLVKLKLDSWWDPQGFAVPELSGITNFACLTKLTGLTIDRYNLASEEPWPALAALSSLKDLQLMIDSPGDPSALSALTGLTLLKIGGWNPRFSFSSLQPLSTMQQLASLALDQVACSATSLHGLSGLSDLVKVDVIAPKLVSLEGLPGGVETLSLSGATLEDMAGLETLSYLRDLSIGWCGDVSLQRLSGLSNLSALEIRHEGPGSSLSSLQGIKGLGNCLKSLWLDSCLSLRSLSGIEALTSLEEVLVWGCGVTSLEPIKDLAAARLESIGIRNCGALEGQRSVLRSTFHGIFPKASVQIY